MLALDGHPGERWIPVARLLRPQGRRGELLAEPLTDQDEIFVRGRQLRLAADPAQVSSAPAIVLEDCWKPQGRNAGRLVLKLADVNSISEAEALETKQLFLPESELPPLDPDTYLVRDLIGCVLFDGDRPLGTVTDLQFPIGSDGRTRLADAVDLLAVTPAGAAPETEPVLIPFVKAWLRSVSVSEKRIEMELPPGLFDEASST